MTLTQNNAEMKYYKSVIFTKTKLEGFFRYTDEFQIYPLQHDALKNVKRYKHYPVIIEFKIEEREWVIPKKDFSFAGDLYDKDAHELLATAMTKLDKIINLINLFSTHLFFRYEDTDGFWTIPATSEKSDEQIRLIEHSDFLYKLFFIKNFTYQCLIDGLTENIESNFNQIEYVDHNIYYSQDPNYDYNTLAPIKFPDFIFYGLNGYFALSEIEKKVIDITIKYASICMKNLEGETTIGILSAFTSIESLMNHYYKDFKPENCKECGQSRYAISRRYTEFLLNFVGESDELKKEYKRLYSFRSKIVHTGFSFITENLWHELDEEQSDEEVIKKLQIMMINKKLIINYLALTALGKRDKHHVQE